MAAVFGALELVARAGLVSERTLPAGTTMLKALGEQLATSAFWSSVADTLEGWAVGLAIAAGVAIPLAILIGSSAHLDRALRAVIEFLRPTPSVALIPLAVLLFGVGTGSKIFLVAWAAAWPLLVQTLYGIRDIDPVATDTARVFGLGWRARLLRITLPGAVPYITTGLRISSAVALILAVTAELVIGSAGVGREINEARANGATDVMYALIVATGFIGLAVSGLTLALERRALRWHPSYSAH